MPFWGRGCGSGPDFILSSGAGKGKIMGRSGGVLQGPSCDDGGTRDCAGSFSAPVSGVAAAYAQRQGRVQASPVTANCKHSTL